MAIELTRDHVTRALGEPLPGEPAQMRMATRPRSSASEFCYDGPPRSAAVLLVLYPSGEGLCFPLTERSSRLTMHRGQVSLPGGRQEAGDVSLWNTALREAQEEIALPGGCVQPLGQLSGLVIPSSNFAITPFIGLMEQRPSLQANPDEVDELFEMPLGLLLDDAIKCQETWVWRGRRTEVPLYRYRGHVIWGATAMILSEFETMLRRALGLSDQDLGATRASHTI